MTTPVPTTTDAEDFSTGRRILTLRHYDPDYDGFMLFISMYPNGQGGCEASYYGDLVQEIVDAKLAHWGCRREAMARLPKEAPYSRERPYVAKLNWTLVGQDTASPEVYTALVKAYCEAIMEMDNRHPKG